jgi:hypothetical protein
MLHTSCLAFLLWSCIALSSPLDKKLGLHNAQVLKRVVAPPNSDIYVSDGNGNLVEGVIAASPDGLLSPYDTVFQADGTCDRRPVIYTPPDQIASVAVNFCNQNTAVVYGSPIKISPDIDCSGLASCSETHALAITATSTFSYTVGEDFQYGISDAIKLTAKLGVTQTWADTTTSTDALTFTPKPGSRGHMVFFPYMLKACGYTVKTNLYFGELIIHYDPMSCGYTPMTLSNQHPDGVSWVFDLDSLI